MTHQYEPKLEPVEILSLRPTQITVGYREVSEKRREWRERADTTGPEFLGHHMVPVIRGPRDRFYVIDHHHLARALHEEGIKHVLISLVGDLGHLGKAEFWTVMDHRRWAYPFDEKGERRPFDDIPKTIEDLIDDPFRSLAGALRNAGGYAKDAAPYNEFQWADYLRRRIKAKSVERDFDAVLLKALALARDRDASHLPGWCGPA